MRRDIATLSSEIEEMAGKMTVPIGLTAVPPRWILWYDTHTSNLGEGIPTDVYMAIACFDGVLCPVQPTPALRS